MWAQDCGPNAWCEWGTELGGKSTMFRWDNLKIKSVYVICDVAINNGLAIDRERYEVVAMGADYAGFVE